MESQKERAKEIKGRILREMKGPLRNWSPRQECWSACYQPGGMPFPDPATPPRPIMPHDAP